MWDRANSAAPVLLINSGSLFLGAKINSGAGTVIGGWGHHGRGFEILRFWCLTTDWAEQRVDGGPLRGEWEWEMAMTTRCLTLEPQCNRGGILHFV